MGFIKSTVFVFVLLYAVGFVISQETTTEPPSTTSSIVATTTVITTSSTPETTVKPTSPPTTEPPPPLTTTVPPTTPKPPLPEIGSWNVTGQNGTCIRAKLQIEFNIVVGEEKISFALSPNASTDGSDCNAPNDTQVLALTEPGYGLTFIFAKDSSKVYVEHVVFAYNTRQGEDVFYNSSKLFEVNAGNSYQCKSTDSILMGNATIEIYYIHIQAYGTKGEDDFSTAEECELDDKVSDIIPIAVACALAALIIIVLIAYLVGRRRSRQKGYTSV